MIIEIDKYAGFCFGVTKAIKSSENHAAISKNVYSLGKILHNSKEEERLKKLGLKTINYDNIQNISKEKVIIRAHGEPPEVYDLLKKNNIEIIDETCPVVLKLQKKIQKVYDENKNVQIIIFGKKGHAEVNGLVGQTENNAKVISSLDEAKEIDITKPIFLFSQTTSDYYEYQQIEKYLKDKIKETTNKLDNIVVFQTICPSVIKRIPKLKEFCSKHDIIIFVSDYNSSNGKMLFDVCKETNENSYFVTDVQELNENWFVNKKNIGISGATSTPLWLMEEIKSEIKKFKIFL